MPKHTSWPSIFYVQVHTLNQYPSHDIDGIFVLYKTMHVCVSKICISHCSVISRGRLFLKLLLVPHPPLHLSHKSVRCIVWYCSDWKSYAVTWDGRSERRRTIPLGLSWGTYNIDETGQYLELLHFPFESCFRFCYHYLPIISLLKSLSLKLPSHWDVSLSQSVYCSLFIIHTPLQK